MIVYFMKIQSQNIYFEKYSFKPPLEIEWWPPKL